jgi:hypothetical protein
MKLIAMSNVLAAWIALFLVGTTEAAKAGLRQLGSQPPDGRSLEAPQCAICKDMYDSLKDATSLISCETTCDMMAETLGGGPEDRTSSRTSLRTGSKLCSSVRKQAASPQLFSRTFLSSFVSHPALADMVMAACDPLCEIIFDGATAGESAGSACSYVGLC